MRADMPGTLDPAHSEPGAIPHTTISLRVRKIAHTQIRYSYRYARSMLRRDSWSVGRSLVYRLIAKKIWFCAKGDRAAARQRKNREVRYRASQINTHGVCLHRRVAAR